MHRNRLRAASLALAVAVLVLLPAAAQALEPAAPVSAPAEERSFIAGFWHLLASLFPGQEATAACDTGILIDPDGRNGCGAAGESDSRIQIDPNG